MSEGAENGMRSLRGLWEVAKSGEPELQAHRPLPRAREQLRSCELPGAADADDVRGISCTFAGTE